MGGLGSLQPSPQYGSQGQMGVAQPQQGGAVGMNLFGTAPSNHQQGQQGQQGQLAQGYRPPAISMPPQGQAQGMGQGSSSMGNMGQPTQQQQGYGQQQQQGYGQQQQPGMMMTQPGIQGGQPSMMIHGQQQGQNQTNPFDFLK